MILAQKQLIQKVVEEEMLIELELPTCVYNYFERNPLNNIIHNLVVNFIIGLNNSNFTKLKKKLISNSGFFTILENISNQKENKRKRQKLCYLGHIKKLGNYFSKNLLKSENDERWVEFKENFLKIENEKENKALGDVYVNNDADDDEIMFTFSIEEIKEKYFDFLGYKTENVEIENNKSENEDEEDDTDTNLNELIDEFSDDVDLQNENSAELLKQKEVKEFNDNNYWRSNIKFNVEDIMAKYN